MPLSADGSASVRAARPPDDRLPAGPQRLDRSDPGLSPAPDSAHVHDRYRARLEDLVVSRTVELAQASERAEAVGRAQGASLAHARHEIRLPLNVITSLAAQMQVDEADAGQRGRLRAMEQAARHLEALVDDVLDLARDDRGSRAVRNQPLRPAALLSDVATMLQPQAHTRGVAIEVDDPAPASEPTPDTAPVPPAEWRLRGDAVRLRQALLCAAQWALGCAEPGPLRLQVHAGMPGAERLDLRFQVTFRALAPRFDACADANLASLQRLSSLVGGDCGLQPAPNGQWCCWFTTPLELDRSMATQAAGAADAVAERLRQRHAGRRVLVVEDDMVNQTVMLELLADVGLHADTANDGQEALDCVARQAYALVAMDLRMPRLDGLGAARALRGMPSMNDMPIIAVTANAFEEDRAACRAAGMDDFLPKPIDVDRLYALLLHWLDRSPVGRVEPPPQALPRPERAAGVSPGLEPLVALEGVDAMGGLASVGGRIETYRRLLGVFVDTHHGDGQQVLQCLQQGDRDAAGRLAHRLRGGAATLGLVDVETAAAELETAVEQGPDCAPLVMLQPLAAAVDRALAATVPAVRSALSR